ncbi:unnamed protein product, partial [Mesorhabditis belari]|uniref:G protein-coupled receptor n=1 Tax=Mesorhabditis belari TaxID=2138241 RepID=A0AAF3FEG1_9BILA
MDNVIDLSQAPAMLFWFRIVSGLTIWVNILCLYLIAVATPRGLGNFRWHMFALHFIDDSFSVLPNVLRVRGSLLAFPMLGLPAQGGFAIGPLADCGFDVYWQLIVLIYVTVAVVSSTQILGFIRQQSVLKNEHFLKLKPRHKRYWIVFSYVFPIFWTVSIMLILWGNDVHKALDGFQNEYPYLAPFFQQRSSFGVELDFGRRTIIPSIGFVIFYTAVFIVLVATALSSLKAMEKSMSRRTLEIQKQWLKHVYTQRTTGSLCSQNNLTEISALEPFCGPI